MKPGPYVRGLQKFTNMALQEQKAALRKRTANELKRLDSNEIERQCRQSGRPKGGSADCLQAAVVANMVLQMPGYQKARSLAVFLSMPGKEVSTRDIVLHALAQGKSVFVPYIHPGEVPRSKVMDMLQLKNEDDFHSLKPDAWGIPSLSDESVSSRRNALSGFGISNEPSDEKTSPPALDLVLMPAVAFDHANHRLGHGKGFYDRYLARYKNALRADQAAKSMPLLGRCLSFGRSSCFSS